MYKLTDTGVVIRIADNAFIPDDDANTDRADYNIWIAAGNVPTPADPVLQQIPQSVSRFQAMAALHLAGHLDNVEAFMSAPETSVITKLAWANALVFNRNSPTVALLAVVLDLSPEEIDTLFITAAGIEA